MAEKNTKKVDNRAPEVVSEEDAGNANAHASAYDHDSTERSQLLNHISEQIMSLNTTLNANWTTFKEDFKKEMKDEFAQFKIQIHQQLATTSLKLQDHEQKLEEMAARIDEQETWAAVANEALSRSLKEQSALQDQVNDLESRSRRNNMRIYGVPEGAEGSSVIQFVEGLLANEKLISGGTDPQIQRAHRSLAPRPNPNAPPRSIVVNFLQFRVKETILRNAWKKKIQIGDRILSFDFDYTTDVIQKRKEYKAIKAALKERGVRFQTPFTRMRIHWDSGPQMYNSAGDAERELRKRGFFAGHTEEHVSEGPITSQQLEQTSPWHDAWRGRQRNAHENDCRSFSVNPDNEPGAVFKKRNTMMSPRVTGTRCVF
ncbi:unnamed protein product [Knipowitschia caucasica]